MLVDCGRTDQNVVKLFEEIEATQCDMILDRNVVKMPIRPMSSINYAARHFWGNWGYQEKPRAGRHMNHIDHEAESEIRLKAISINNKPLQASCSKSERFKTTPIKLRRPSRLMNNGINIDWRLGRSPLGVHRTQTWIRLEQHLPNSRSNQRDHECQTAEPMNSQRQ